MDNVLIRLAKLEDYDKIEYIMKQVHELHVNWRPDTYKVCETVLPYEVFEKAVREQTFLVAELNEEVVGLLHYIIRHIEVSNQVTRDTLYVESMAVDETHRGKGIGHKLFDYVKNIVIENHYDAFELQVNAKNVRAKEMYERYGFTEKSINMELKL